MSNVLALIEEALEDELQRLVRERLEEETEDQAVYLYAVRPRQGWRPFPVDMLRYDSSWPAEESEAHKIERLVEVSGTDREPETVVLRKRGEVVGFERWRSKYGWCVIGSPVNAYNTNVEEMKALR